MWHATTSKWSKAIIESPLTFASATGALSICFAVGLSRAAAMSILRSAPGSSPSVNEMRAVRDRHDASTTQWILNCLRKYFRFSDGTMLYLTRVRNAWLEASDAEKVAYMIVGINIAVTAVWQFSALYNKRLPKSFTFMQRWILHNSRPHQGLQCWAPLFTSIFSHQIGRHLVANMAGITALAKRTGDYTSSGNVQAGGKYNASRYRIQAGRVMNDNRSEPQELSGSKSRVRVYATANPLSC